MPVKSNMVFVFVFIGICLWSDVSAIYSLLLSDNFSPQNWGVMGRVVMPLIFYLCGLKIKERKKRNIVLLIGTSRFLHYNIIAVYSDLRLAIAVAVMALLVDIIAFYKTLKIAKKNNGVRP